MSMPISFVSADCTAYLAFDVSGRLDLSATYNPAILENP